ncbi:MAG: hypothetical protein ACFE8L_13200 [Candidatus Hodarchaeota archaeon]
MSKDKTNNSQSSRLSFRDLQHQIEDFRQKRDELNKKTKDFINGLQDIEIEINTTLKIAKEKYRKKRDYWNNKVKKLKEKKIEYKTLLDNFIEEKKNIQKSTNDGKASKSFISIKQIERKIDNLERKIETENLNIAEENAIIDDIRKLAAMKQEYFIEQQNSDLFKLERKIEIVKINLNKIYEQLNKWSNKSQEYHAKMQELFQKVNTLKEKKKKTEEELIENKKAADHYHGQFLKLMNQRRKFSKGKRPYYPSKKPVKKPTLSTKKNELLEKLKQDKLEKALEKQKAGKKLNLYEARLILEKSKG